MTSWTTIEIKLHTEIDVKSALEALEELGWSLYHPESTTHVAYTIYEVDTAAEWSVGTREEMVEMMIRNSRAGQGIGFSMYFTVGEHTTNTHFYIENTKKTLILTINDIDKIYIDTPVLTTDISWYLKKTLPAFLDRRVNPCPGFDSIICTDVM